jgi:uncharacterized protein (TIGR00730 family)
MDRKRVTVFGGSKPLPGEPAYEEALLLGHLLGQKGYQVLTGGYIGTMEAVSRGAAGAGGTVIGVTCEQIEAWRPGKANRWVQEELRFPTLRQRLFTLIDQCDAALALPGGPGTLAEIALMWNQLLTGSIPPRPLILIGAGWIKTLDAFFNALGEYTPAPQRAWLSFSPNVEEAVKLLEQAIRP